MSEIEAVSEAIAESAKFGTTSVKFTETMLCFISKILGNPIEEAAGIIGDKLQYIRWQRQMRMVDEVNKILISKDLDKTRTIPPKFALPMLEQASLEEDDYLQDIWCKLIANSLDPNFDSEIRYAFIEIIKNLTPLDAKILKYVYDTALKNCSHFEDISFRNNVIKLHRKTPIYIIRKNINANNDEIEASLDNLLRVRCLKDNVLDDSILEMWKVENPSLTSSNFSLTQFGIIFVEACLKL